MTGTTTLTIYCLLTGLVSLAGGWLGGRMRVGHTRMEMVMSFVSGLMLGVALFHMIPHGIERLRSVHDAGYWIAGGILVMFLLIRVFHVHAHGEAGTDCQHAPHPHSHGPGESRRASGVGVFSGMTIHSLLDGVALAAAVHAGARDARETMLFGLGTFLAILLHKPLDSLSIVSVMGSGGWSRPARNAANISYALTVPAGALLFHYGIAGGGDAAIGAALCFSGGLFLCIALADLLPEIQFHRHDRIKLTAALLAGIAFAWLVGLLHPHDTPRNSPLLERAHERDR